MTGAVATAWVMAFVSMVSPDVLTTTDRCEAILTEHGNSRCVDEIDLARYQGALQRFAACGLSIFYLVQFASAYGFLHEANQELTWAPE